MHKKNLVVYIFFKVNEEWAKESDENYIDVTLLDKKNEIHLYDLDYKKKKPNRKDEETNLIQKVNDYTNTLRFRLTDDDFKRGFKS